MKKITIKDVAKEAGVALSTASNAINGSEVVKEETRQKVLEAAQKLNYVPNIGGRLLKSGRSKMLCFITSTIKGEYFYRLIDKIGEEGSIKGYELNILVSRDKKAIINRLYGGGYDGFFIFEGERIQEEELLRMESESIKAVMFDRIYQSENISSIVFDSYRAGYQITKYLINLGHKRIGFIDTYADTFDCIERKRGYIDALKKHNIEFFKDDVIQGMFDENITYTAMLAYFEIYGTIKPTAFVAGNDKSAIGCIKALKTLGYQTPRDISVVGFDDIDISQYFSPALTTIRNPIEEQGLKAINLLIDMIENERLGYTEVLKGEIIPRDSAGINFYGSK